MQTIAQAWEEVRETCRDTPVEGCALLLMFPGFVVIKAVSIPLLFLIKKVAAPPEPEEDGQDNGP